MPIESSWHKTIMVNTVEGLGKICVDYIYLEFIAKESNIYEWRLRLQVTVDLPERKPCCSSIRIWFKEERIDLSTSVSYNLDKWGRIDIGRKFATSVESPDFNIGLIEPSLRADGKIPESIERLNNNHNGSDSTDRSFYKKSPWIPSGPTDFILRREHKHW